MYNTIHIKMQLYRKMLIILSTQLNILKKQNEYLLQRITYLQTSNQTLLEIKNTTLTTTKQTKQLELLLKEEITNHHKFINLIQTTEHTFQFQSSSTTFNIPLTLPTHSNTSNDIETFIYLANVSHNHNEHNKAEYFINNIIKHKSTDLTQQEQHLFNTTYNNVTSNKLKLINILSNSNDSHMNIEYINAYKNKLITELEKICLNVITTIDEYLLPKAVCNENKVLYLKMKGDYCRYLCLIYSGDKQQKYIDIGKNAFNLAIKNSYGIEYDKTVKLELMLSLSMFYYEVVNDVEKAVNVSEEAVLKGKNALIDKNKEIEEIKQAKLIIELLEQNMKIWKEEKGNVEGSMIECFLFQ